MGFDSAFEYEAECRNMIGFLMYCGAVLAGLLLFMFYRPSEEKQEQVVDPRFRIHRKNQHEFEFRNLLNRMGINCEGQGHFEAFTDHFKTFDEVASACKRAGLEKCNLIIGVDFTASNEWQGRKTFSQNCLHKISGSRILNPYQRVIWIMGQTLASFDEDNLIPCFGFGDAHTADEYVFAFKDDGSPCVGFQEVLQCYNQLIPRLTLSGPTSFAPVIRAAIEIVKEKQTYHILVIIADGQVNEEQPTIDAIIEASNYPISIIVIGVGDGPWSIMEEFDHRLPRRKFDNFRFVDYHKATSKAKNPDTAFALQALMEIPDQYKTMKYLGYISPDVTDNTESNRETFESKYGDPYSKFSVKSKTLSCLEEQALNNKESPKDIHKSGSYSAAGTLLGNSINTQLQQTKSSRTNSLCLSKLVMEEKRGRRRFSAFNQS